MIARSAARNRLTDDVVSLAPPELADAVTVLQWDADLEIQRWFDWPLTPPVDDPETYGVRLASAERTVRNMWAEWDAGDAFTFVIRSVESGRGQGWIDLRPRGPGRGSVSYGVLSGCRRQGAATRSLVLAAGYAFDVLGWSRLEIQTNADNVASRSVATKAGFRLEGVLRSYGAMEKHQPLLGQRFDWAIYGRLRGEK